MQVVKKAAKPMPNWGPASPENRKGRYTIRSEDMLPVCPCIIEVNNISNGFTNTGFIEENEHPEHLSPIYNVLSHHDEEKDDELTSGDAKDVDLTFSNVLNYNQLSLSGPAALQD